MLRINFQNKLRYKNKCKDFYLFFRRVKALMDDWKKGLRRSIIECNGYKVVENIPAKHAQCPKCGKVYKFSQAPGVGELWEKEQHLGGYCSDKCWPLK